MRRDPMPLLVILVLVLLGAAAWLTQDPDHPVWDRLARLPRVGQAVEELRRGFRPAPERAVAPPAVEYVYLGGEPGDRPIDLTGGPAGSIGRSRPLGRVWVRAGTELRQAPDAASPVVGKLAGLRTMSLLESRGGWRRVHQAGLEGSTTEGWVRAEALGEPTREELWRAEPVVPLAAVAAAEEIVGVARELMGGAVGEAPCGPYRLLTDTAGPTVDGCARLAGQLDGLYAARTGLAPVGGPAETILLFDSEGAYLLFRTRVSPDSRRHAFAAPARGFVAVAAGGRPPEQVQATVVHELVHLLNRRHLGPALPSWLDEGLAEELAMSRIEADGVLTPGTLGRWRAGAGDTVLLGGGEVALRELCARLRRGQLPTLERLAGLDRAGFQAEGRFHVHYSLSAFWVRYLLGAEGPAGGAGFRGFLAAVAAGERLDEELLLGRLGAGWAELERGFRDWLERAG